MIRKILKLQNNKFSIDLPDDFVGKDIEVLIFPISDDKSKRKKDNALKLGSDNFLDLETQIKSAKDSELKNDAVKLKLRDTDEIEKEEDDKDTKDKIKDEYISQSPIIETIKTELKFEANALVVEDNEINQQLIIRILKEMGLHVSIAQNGLVALQKRKKEDYDIIFMDIAMPIMDGIEATKNIKKYEKENNLPHVPIVAFTANSSQKDREQFMKQGVDEYMTKPVKKDRVATILDMFLNNSESHAKQSESIDEPKAKKSDKKVKNHIEILIFRKSAIETNVAKSIISQLHISCDICSSLDEFRQKINATHYSLVLFDYEIEDLSLSKISQWKRRAQTKHKQGDINFVMFAENSSDISKVKSSAISEIIQDLIGRVHFEKLIRDYIKL